MKYTSPDEETLAKYLALLREVIVQTRSRAYGHDEQVAALLDAVENVPDLLCRWPDMKESIVLGGLEAYEARYLNGGDRLSGILKRGPGDNWQLVWQSKDEHAEGE